MAGSATTLKGLGNAVMSVLPDGPRIAIKRHVRGYRERSRLARADLVVIGHPKSGNTWLRFQVARVYQQKYGLDEAVIPDVEVLHGLNTSIPQIHMGAYNYIRPLLTGPAPAPSLEGKAVVFMVRHPLDIMVSLYLHIQKHALRERKLINDWPLDLSNLSMLDFALKSTWGLRPLIAFFNDSLRQQRQLERSMILPYETMRTQPVDTLMSVTALARAPVTLQEAEEATAFASFDNLRKAEVENRFKTTRLRAANPNDPDSFKVRRAKVEGFRDYFSESELRELAAIIDRELDPAFGYRVLPVAPASPSQI
jgi:hypothetical protein